MFDFIYMESALADVFAQQLAGASQMASSSL